MARVVSQQGGSPGSSVHGLRRGIRPGEGAMREVAAFLLDHDHFAGVPPTALVSCHAGTEADSAEGAKVGSLQVRPHAAFTRRSIPSRACRLLFANVPE